MHSNCNFDGWGNPMNPCQPMIPSHPPPNPPPQHIPMMHPPYPPPIYHPHAQPQPASLMAMQLQPQFVRGPGVSVPAIQPNQYRNESISVSPDIDHRNHKKRKLSPSDSEERDTKRQKLMAECQEKETEIRELRGDLANRTEEVKRKRRLILDTAKKWNETKEELIMIKARNIELEHDINYIRVQHQYDSKQLDTQRMKLIESKLENQKLRQELRGMKKNLIMKEVEVQTQCMMEDELDDILERALNEFEVEQLKQSLRETEIERDARKARNKNGRRYHLIYNQEMVSMEEQRFLHTKTHRKSNKMNSKR